MFNYGNDLIADTTLAIFSLYILKKYFEIFFQKKDNQCRPLSFWTNQDIWDYIKLCNLPVSDLYSQGYQRNGCMYCGFGLCSERRKFGINRFERLAQTHPKQYEYMISRWASLFKECGIPY